MKCIDFKKTSLLIANITYVILIVLASYFYIERTIFTDAAFYMFKMINFEKFIIEFGRYGAVLYEIPSFIALKLGLTLKAIIFLYSIQTVIVSYIAFLICIYYFKNYSCAFTIVLLNFIGISESFFYPIIELNIGLIFCVILFAWLERRKEKNFDYITVIVGALFIVSGILSHPGVVTVIMFLIVYSLIKYKNWKNYNLYILFFILIASLIWKYFQIQENTYESNIFSNIGQFNYLFQNFSGVFSVNYYFDFHFRIYLYHYIIFLFSVFLFLKRKQYMLLGFYAVSYFSLLFLLFLMFYQGESVVMMEKGFMPLTVFLLLPFLNEFIFNVDKRAKLKITFFIIIITLCFYNILNVSKEYRWRIQYLDKITKIAATAKTINYLNEENMKVIKIPWAVGVETLLLTSLSGPEFSKTVYFINNETKLKSSLMSDSSTFLCVPFWQYWNVKKLNSKYFHLPLELYTSPEKNSNNSFLKRVIGMNDDRVQGLIRYIRSNPKWIGEIEEKATLKNIPIDYMLLIDAVWLIEKKLDSLSKINNNNLPENNVIGNIIDKVKNLINHIKSDEKWLEEIKKKAKLKNIPLDLMLVIDAFWLIKEESDSLSIKNNNNLPENKFIENDDDKVKNLINHIKSDPKWLEEIKKKAKLKNIPLDSMLVIDAKWYIQQESDTSSMKKNP